MYRYVLFIVLLYFIFGAAGHMFVLYVLLFC